MAAPRATQFIALRNLQKGSQQIRYLSMTGPKTYASPALANSKPLERPTESKQASAPQPQPARRDFNTSRQLKALKDSSPIDFAYFPTIPTSVETNFMRVPILPDTTTPSAQVIVPEVDEPVVMKPQINTMSLDSVYLPFGDMHDGDAAGIDFHAMASRVGERVRAMRVPVEEQAGLMKRIWSDMVDDMFGASKKTSTA